MQRIDYLHQDPFRHFHHCLLLIQLFKPSIDTKFARTSNGTFVIAMWPQDTTSALCIYSSGRVISFINRRVGDVVQYCSQQTLEDSSSQSMLKRCSLVFKCLSYFDLKVNPFLHTVQASADSVAISILWRQKVTWVRNANSTTTKEPK